MTNIHVYQWFNVNTLEYYIGYTLGKVKNYICSSKHVKPRIQANPNEWHKQILGYFETGAEARAFEEDCIRSMWGDKLLLNRTITGKEFHAEIVCSDEKRAKLSKAHKGRKYPPRSKETLERMRQAQLGKKHSEEHKKKIGLGGLGKKHSEETKAKIRESNIGKILSQEVKDKISNTLKERHKQKRNNDVL